MRKSSRKSAKVFPEKDATLMAEKVCVLKPLVGGWWEETVELTPCNGATPSESRIQGIRTYGSMRGRRSQDLLILCVVVTGDITFQKNNESPWRMYEDEEGLYLENLKTGKIYRFVLHELKKE